METEDMQLVTRLYHEIREQDVTDPVAHILQEVDSNLIRIYGKSVSELQMLDARGFISRLRTQEFGLRYVDMGLLSRLAIEQLDGKKNPFDVEIYTRALGLPGLVMGEWLAKDSGCYRKMMSALWEGYDILMRGDHTFYKPPENILTYLRTLEGDPYEAGLLTLRLKQILPFERAFSITMVFLFSQREK